jgi:hypothetical protein
MEMNLLIWINTLAILLAFVGGGIVLNSQVREIARALARVEEIAARVAETTARNGRLSLAILERISLRDDTP